DDVPVVVSSAAVVQIVDDKDGRIDRQPPQHHKGRIAPLVKIEVKQRKDQKQPDKGNGDNGDDIKGLPQVFEQHGADKVGARNQQQQQAVLPLGLVKAPVVRLLFRRIADGHPRLHLLQYRFQVFIAEFGRTHIIK